MTLSNNLQVVETTLKVPWAGCRGTLPCTARLDVCCPRAPLALVLMNRAQSQ